MFCRARTDPADCSVRVAVAVVAEVAAGAGYAEEAAGADAGADVVGDVVHVQLAEVIAVRRHDPVRPARTRHSNAHVPINQSINQSFICLKSEH